MEFNNSVHPTKEQMEGFLEGDTDTPIAMVNLLKFKKKAEYEDGRDTQMSGKEAYQIYAIEVQEHLKKVGAKLTKLSKEQADYISVGTEGPFKPDAYRY